MSKPLLKLFYLFGLGFLSLIALLVPNVVWGDTSVVSITPQNVTNKFIKATSTRVVFSITVNDSELNSVTLEINPIKTFSTTDLNDLTTNSNSGVGLYQSNQFQTPTTTPTWNGNQTTLNFNPPLPEGTYNVSLNFKSSVADGSQFSAFIPASGVIVSPLTSVETSSTDTFTIDNQIPSNPDIVSAWGDSTRTTPLEQDKNYNFQSPYFEWSGASDTAGINSYYIYFGTNPNGDPLSGTKIDHADTTSFTVASLANNTADYYYLRIATVDNTGLVSNPSTLYTYKYDRKAPSKKPGAPEASTPVTDTTPTWNWDFAYDPDSGIVKYQFYWVKQNSGLNPNYFDIATDPLIPTYTHLTALDGGTWVAGVRAFDEAGNFADSEVGSITIDAPVTIPTMTPTPTPTPTSAPVSNPSNGDFSSSPSSPSNPSNTNPTSNTTTNSKTGDFNNDGKVDLKDLNLFVLSWKKANVPQDLNKDGVVDLKDFNIFVFNWNK